MAGALAGKAAVVTGSSKGIGYAIAEAMVREGADVVVSARAAGEVAEAAERLTALGPGRAVGVPCDVRDQDQVRGLVQAAVDGFGGLDVLVNNAGVGGFGAMPDLDPELFRTVIETNLFGVFYASREAIPHLRQRGGGWIINIGSLAGKNPFAGGAAYNASKFGLIGFSEAMMLDVRHDNIRVSYIMPGSVETYFNQNEPSPEGAWKLQPEDIAEVVMDLLAFPGRALPSRVEIRPTRPKQR